MGFCMQDILAVNRRTGRHYVLADRPAVIFLGAEYYRPCPASFTCVLLGVRVTSMTTTGPESLCHSKKHEQYANLDTKSVKFPHDCKVLIT